MESKACLFSWLRKVGRLQLQDQTWHRSWGPTESDRVGEIHARPKMQGDWKMERKSECLDSQQ